jgi:hypothetical protein
MDLEYEPDTAFAPWYLYDDDSVQLVQRPAPRFAPAPAARAGPGSAQLPVPGAANQASAGDVDDLIKSNQAYILFYRLRNEC